MSRPPLSDQERQQVRQRILGAARELFDTRGVAGVSMRAIGARVGLSASALYAYFPAKQDLFRALWQNALDALQDRFQTLSAGEADPLRALSLLASAYADFAVEDAVRFRLLFLTPPTPETVDPEFRALPQTRMAYNLLRERVAEAIGKRLLRISDVDLACQILWAAVHGVVALETVCTTFPFRPTRALADAALTTALRGLMQGDAPTVGAVSP